MDEYERFKRAHAALVTLEKKHAKVFEDLQPLLEEYNAAMSAVIAGLKNAGKAQSVGPFSAYLQGGESLDLGYLVENFPTLALEPGVVTAVDLDKLRDAAIRRGVEAEITRLFSPKPKTITVRKGSLKELVLLWPRSL